MNNIIQKLKNIWAIEDLRKRIFNTILFLTVNVAGTQILLPGIDSEALRAAVDAKNGEGWEGLIDQYQAEHFFCRFVCKRQ